MDHLSKEQLW